MIQCRRRQPGGKPTAARTVWRRADTFRVMADASSFHEHFKAVTGTTPLQFQKDLRLIKARALLEQGSQAVSEVAFAVGYESPTHLSRDYSRKFGVPRSRDGTFLRGPLEA
jgi:transcriptional regulator GlxA family with amidase domain